MELELIGSFLGQRDLELSRRVDCPLTFLRDVLVVGCWEGWVASGGGPGLGWSGGQGLAVRRRLRTGSAIPGGGASPRQVQGEVAAAVAGGEVDEVAADGGAAVAAWAWLARVPAPSA